MKKTSVSNFNLRVYAIIISAENILLSHELINGENIIKFPGGGVEYGEGTIEALQREAKEEMNLNLKDVKHFYTTDFFQQSSFIKSDQLICIYYLASLEKDIFSSIHLNQPTKDHPTFCWYNVNKLTKKMFHFPIDRHVYSLVKQMF